MRNLITVGRQTHYVESLHTFGQPLTFATFDPAGNDLYTLFGPSEEQALIEIEAHSITDLGKAKARTIAAWEIDSDDICRDIHYFPDSEVLVIVFQSGNIYQISGVQEEHPEIDLVGTIDVGIACASWSPDDQVLAISTGNSLILLSRQFEPLSETVYDPADLAISRHVSVGWGKKETQFQGKGAKAPGLHDPTMPETVDEGVLSVHDDHTMRISWRGDGEYVAVTSIDKTSVERRTIRVFSREEGTLDSVSEPVDGLESVICWRPSGNVVAGLQRYKDYFRVVFFERNGLRRYEFDLNLPSDTHIHDLVWNAESNILALQLHDRIQLWTTGNYHWYLKREIYPQSMSTIKRIAWHQGDGMKFLIQTKEAVEVHTLVFDVFRGPQSTPNDYGTMAVVDGSTVKMTPLRIVGMPPPLGFRKFNVAATPVAVAISKSNSRIVIGTQKNIQLAEWSLEDHRKINAPTIILSAKIDDILSPGASIRQIAFLEDSVVALAVDSLQSSELIFLKIVPKAGQASHLEFEEIFKEGFATEIHRIGSREDYKAVFVETWDGALSEVEMDVSPDCNDIAIAPIITLPMVCSWMSLVNVEGDSIVFGQTPTGKLFANGRQISISCTSFVVTNSYLAFITSQNILKMAHLVANEEEIKIPEDSDGSELCRAVERGARIVTAIPSKFSIILQMPRGNIETVCPRLLVLASVRRDIDNLNYKEAFLTCRTNRVDLNLLYDYDPQKFLDKTALFVSQISRVDYLDLFLCALNGKDVTETIYKETGVSSKLKGSNEGLLDNSNKVNLVCDAILKVLLQNKYRSTHLQTILTAYACKVPPAIDDALKLVSQLQQEGEAKNDVSAVEEAVQHLTFLQDVDALYDAALGSYDMKLTLLVAQQSQRDPREYLPFIQELGSMSELRRQFTIDSHLKRYTLAADKLFELYNSEKSSNKDDNDTIFKEFLNYIIEKKLYTHAMHICRHDINCQNRVLEKYALYCEEEKEYRTAGLAYEMLQQFSSALENYRESASSWREALFCLDELEGTSEALSLQDKSDLYKDLAEKLVDGRKYQEAASVYVEYIDNIPSALDALSKGFLFDEATRLVALKANNKDNRESLMNQVDDLLNDAFAQTSELLSECQSQLNSQVKRLKELRVKKVENPIAYFEGAEESDMPDNVSIAPSEISTSASIYTRYTGRTDRTAGTGVSRRSSKNKRRVERKRARGKKGSVYEEEYLINSIGRLVDRVNSTNPDAVNLIRTLARRYKRTQAASLQSHFVALTKDIQDNIGWVYTLSERDRERLDDNGLVYLIPEPVAPKLEPFSTVPLLEF